ncbi:CoA pyrophosphatase [Novosphingobium lentum]|uniref:CoA pyrophosphatase n=1 Tax=Novosphingobium lentum TaxID=145287 RepID=UPI0008354DB4|nr:CoA pyrophosphatase [Novosphingobium lentum]
MTAPLIDRLQSLYGAGHAEPVEGLRDDSRFSGREDLREAAVLVAVTDRAEPGVLVIHRPTNMRSHPGQAAFPGGKIDPGESAIEAALREAEEELGIRAADVTVIGASDRYSTGSGYVITPVLAVIPADLPIHPNPHEVADWFEPPFGYILDSANHQVKTGTWNGVTRDYLEILWNGHRIWGVTAGMIANLARRIAWHG